MVKRQKEKQYQSARENRNNAQIRSGSGMSGGVVQRRLPFSCCALTQIPFENPVCTSNGIIFESSALVDFILQQGKDPMTGATITTKDIIDLHMDKDEEDRWQCPVLTKPFSDNTKIVAVWDRSCNEAYVYSFEAYKELNLKTKNYVDLTTGKKFNPKRDVLILNDPLDEAFQAKRNVESFWYIQNGRSVQKSSGSKSNSNVKYSVTASRIMESIEKEKEKKRRKEVNVTSISATKRSKIISEDVTGVKQTSGKTAGSLTSSAMDVSYQTSAREATQEEILQSQFRLMRQRKEKGYVRMMTTHGDLLLELHCDIAPRTCTNFLGLCQAKKYDGTKFHRLIPGFMIQGGKALTGEDASLWGPAFADEFDDRLKHKGSGVLSMANAGPGTGKRQFFLTFKSCPHLDRKHSVFGEVVDGMPVLEKLQRIKTGKNDKPLEDIKITKMDILTDPAKEAQLLEMERIEGLVKERENGKKESTTKSKSLKDQSTSTASKSSASGIIGKYLPVNVVEAKLEEPQKIDISALPPPSTKAKSKPKATSFGDFSGW